PARQWTILLPSHGHRPSHPASCSCAKPSTPPASGTDFKPIFQAGGSSALDRNLRLRRPQRCKVCEESQSLDIAYHQSLPWLSAVQGRPSVAKNACGSGYGGREYASAPESDVAAGLVCGIALGRVAHAQKDPVALNVEAERLYRAG